MQTLGDFLAQLPCAAIVCERCQSPTWMIVHPITRQVECDNPPCRWARAAQAAQQPGVEPPVTVAATAAHPPLAGRWGWQANARRHAVAELTSCVGGRAVVTVRALILRSGVSRRVVERWLRTPGVEIVTPATRPHLIYLDTIPRECRERLRGAS